MRWFAKPVRGFEPLHGFESRPLRQLLIFHQSALVVVGRLWLDFLQSHAAVAVHRSDFTYLAIVGGHGEALEVSLAVAKTGETGPW